MKPYQQNLLCQWWKNIWNVTTGNHQGLYFLRKCERDFNEINSRIWNEQSHSGCL